MIDSFQLEHYHDTTDTLGVKEIIHHRGFTPIGNKLNLTSQRHTHWLKFTLKNPTATSQARIIASSESESYFMISFDFFEFDAGNTLLRHTSSRSETSENQEEFLDTMLFYTVTLDPGQSKTLYIKYRSDFPLISSFTVYKPESFYKKRALQNYFYLFYFGVAFAIFMYNLIIYIFNRENIYLYYLLYLAAFNTWIGVHSGFIAIFTPVWLLELLFLSIPMTLFLFIVFSQKLLHSTIKKAFFTTFSNVYKGLTFVVMAVMLIDLQSGTTLVSVVLLPFFIYGFLILRYGSKEMRLYSYALTFYLLTVIPVPLIELDIISDSFFSRHINIFGSMVEIILFSVVLGNRIDNLNREKLAMHRELIASQSRQNTWLQQQIGEQTKELKLLFQELHHRVKNNFQFILNFIWLQKSSVQDPNAVEALEIAAKRIQAISALHELLYKKENTAVDFKDYFREFLLTSKINLAGIAVENRIQNIHLPFDIAVTFGLILNELITNSQKYAFRGIEKPKITIDFYPEGDQRIFTYKDNGTGFDKTILENNPGLGYELIYEFVQKLGSATMELDSKNGVSATIRFICEGKNG